jgi:hypothetical protein
MMRVLCPHCGVPLCDPVPWGALGRAANCPDCSSTFLFRYPLKGSEREALVNAAMLAALASGPLHGQLARWIRAWGRIVHAYVSEGRTDDAQRAVRFMRHLERCSRNSGLCRAVTP